MAVAFFIVVLIFVFVLVVIIRVFMCLVRLSLVLVAPIRRLNGMPASGPSWALFLPSLA